MINRFVFVFWVFCFITGCKKQANDVNCFSNSHIEGGACVCDEGWFGWNCEKNSAEVCGINGYGYEDWCLCNTGWTGNKCVIPVGRLAGRYYMTGTYSSWSGPTSSPAIDIEDTIDIILHTDTLIVDNYKYLYRAFGDSANNYTFYWPFHNNHSYSYLYFRKSNDSLYFSRYIGSLGSGTRTILQGVKIQ